MDNHVEHFYQTGKLLNGTYYFDPPLIEPEIRELHNMFGHIRGNKIILNPLSDDTRYTGNYNLSRTLLWLDVFRNTITGWQNVDTVDDEDGTGPYDLDNLAGIERWCANNDCNMPFRDGRLFLADLPNTEDIFNQLNESDEFDWVPKFTDPSKLKNMDLVNFLNQYFKGGGYDYRSEYDDYYYTIYDNSGYYETIEDNKTFTLKRLKNSILNSITDMNLNLASRDDKEHWDETIREYQKLYQALEPLFK